MKEYKVLNLTEEGGWLTSSYKFDPKAVEDLLNKYAMQGWILKESIIHEKEGRKDQIIFVLERDN